MSVGHFYRTLFSFTTFKFLVDLLRPSHFISTNPFFFFCDHWSTLPCITFGIQSVLQGVSLCIELTVVICTDFTTGTGTLDILVQDILGSKCL